jgi:hypothetical protein
VIGPDDAGEQLASAKAVLCTSVRNRLWVLRGFSAAIPVMLGLGSFQKFAMKRA